MLVASSKTAIIVKDAADLELAEQMLGGIKITTQGHRHIGAALCSEEFKGELVKKKKSKWVKDVEELVIIAEDESQSASSALNTTIAHGLYTENGARYF